MVIIRFLVLSIFLSCLGVSAKASMGLGASIDADTIASKGERFAKIRWIGAADEDATYQDGATGFGAGGGGAGGSSSGSVTTPSGGDSKKPLAEQEYVCPSEYKSCPACAIGVGASCTAGATTLYSRCRFSNEYKYDKDTCDLDDGYQLLEPKCTIEYLGTKYKYCKCKKTHTQCDESDGMACSGWICKNSVCEGCKCTVSGVGDSCPCGSTCTATKCGGSVCTARSCSECPPPPPPPPCPKDESFLCSSVPDPQCGAGEQLVSTTVIQIDSKGCERDCPANKCNDPCGSCYCDKDRSMIDVGTCPSTYKSIPANGCPSSCNKECCWSEGQATNVCECPYFVCEGKPQGADCIGKDSLTTATCSGACPGE
jgi:hypothetical protein